MLSGVQNENHEIILFLLKLMTLEWKKKENVLLSIGGGMKNGNCEPFSHFSSLFLLDEKVATAHWFSLFFQRPRQDKFNKLKHLNLFYIVNQLSQFKTFKEAINNMHRMKYGLANLKSFCPNTNGRCRVFNLSFIFIRTCLLYKFVSERLF